MTDPVSQVMGLAAAAQATPKTAQPARVESAAKQFEALMIAQMLRSARESGSGGLGDETDSSGSTMLDVADQQFSQLLANKGGLGLANLVVKGLNKSANH